MKNDSYTNQRYFVTVAVGCVLCFLTLILFLTCNRRRAFTEASSIAYTRCLGDGDNMNRFPSLGNLQALPNFSRPPSPPPNYPAPSCFPPPSGGSTLGRSALHNSRGRLNSMGGALGSVQFSKDTLEKSLAQAQGGCLSKNKNSDE